MRKRRKILPRPKRRWLVSKEFGELWGNLFETDVSLVLRFDDLGSGVYLWGTSWPLDDLPYPLLLDLENFMASFLGRARAAKAAKGKAAVVKDEEFSSLYPAISEFLYATVDDEGKPRLTATLMLFADGGLVKALLNDRQNQQSLWAQGSSFEEALSDLDRRIQDDTSAWRDNQTGKRQK